MASTEAQLAEQYRKQQALYEKHYLPLLGEMEDESKSRAFVEDATETAANLESNALSSASRASTRHIGGLTPAQQANLERGVKTTAATSGTSLVNKARSLQRTRNEAITGDIMGISNAMQSGATADLGAIANAEAARQAQYEQQKAQAAGGIGSLVGGVAGAIVGGPAGAAVGAGVGQQIGGSF